MYAAITHSKVDPARVAEVSQRAEREYLPKLQKAPGFVARYMVQDAPDRRTVITIWDNEAHAEAFRHEAESWGKTLEQLGVHMESGHKGEVLSHQTPQK